MWYLGCLFYLYQAEQLSIKPHKQDRQRPHDNNTKQNFNSQHIFLFKYTSLCLLASCQICLIWEPALPYFCYHPQNNGTKSWYYMEQIWKLLELNSTCIRYCICNLGYIAYENCTIKKTWINSSRILWNYCQCWSMLSVSEQYQGQFEDPVSSSDWGSYNIWQNMEQRGHSSNHLIITAGDILVHRSQILREICRTHLQRYRKIDIALTWSWYKYWI